MACVSFHQTHFVAHICTSCFLFCRVQPLKLNYQCVTHAHIEKIYILQSSLRCYKGKQFSGCFCVCLNVSPHELGAHTHHSSRPQWAFCIQCRQESSAFSLWKTSHFVDGTKKSRSSRRISAFRDPWIPYMAYNIIIQKRTPQTEFIVD